METKNKVSGVVGVSWCKKRGKWRAEIVLFQKGWVCLGFFKTIYKASKARSKAEIKHRFKGAFESTDAFLYTKKHGKCFKPKIKKTVEPVEPVAPVAEFKPKYIIRRNPLRGIAL